jgi:ADP-heptose:LPS heptosyltransferase
MTVRVLVARLDSAGDVVLSGPAIRAAAAGTGDEDAEVCLLCGPAGEPAARLLPGVTNVITWRCPWIEADPDAVRPGDISALQGLLAAARPSVALILTSFHQSALPLALVLRLAGVPRIAAISADYPGSLLDLRLRPGVDFDDDLPEPERALVVVRAAGFRLPQGDSGGLRITAAPEVLALTGAGPYLVVHPGASVPARAAPPRRYREVVAALAERGHRVVVTGGPAERELTAYVAGSDALDLGGRTTFAQLSGVLAAADSVVVGNTAPAHLAAATGTPVVSLFAPVVPASRWAPYRVPHVLLGDQDAGCAGSRARVCPVPGHPCLDSVTASEVVTAVESLRGVAA